MFSETEIAFFLLAHLAIFVLINLHNILIVHKRRNRQQPERMVTRPSSISVSLAALGTMIYFLEVPTYVLLVLTKLVSLTSLPLSFQSSFLFYSQIPGLVFTSVGYALFLWSVVTRGRYAVSWNMPEDQKLVTTGPYHYVRHPSYLGYFLMFIGLPFLVPNVFALIPLVAIPGYYQVTFQEERLLTDHFGDEYLEYQRKTGRLFPKLWREA